MEKVIKEKCLCGDGKSSIFDSRKNYILMKFAESGLKELEQQYI